MSFEKKKVSRFELLMDAGFGAQKAGDILIRAFARIGRDVYIEPIIPAEISPPARYPAALSGAVIRIAGFNLTNIGNNTDLILASHEIVLNRRIDDEEYNDHCRILLDMGDKKLNEESYERVCRRVVELGLTIYPFEITGKSREIIKLLVGRGKNMFYLGMLSSFYTMPEENIIHEITLSFGKRLSEEVLNKNIEIFQDGYAYAQEHFDFSFEIEGASRDDSEKILIDGNSALSMGIIDAGIQLISGYPITPASSILHTLAKTFSSYGGIVHQAEDEISAIGTAIGSYYGGKPAITCTSGPGLSLMQEFIGYATAAEVPLMVVDVQRGGPSTGMPTKTEQSDLLAVLYGCHGDNTKIIISVTDIVDCFYAPHLARYLTERLRLPVFIMSDFQTANSYKILKKPHVMEMRQSEAINDFVLDLFRINRLPDDIEMVRDEQAVPGIADGMRRITGLNTDENGKVNYFAKANQRSHRIRNRKVHHVRIAQKEPTMIGEKKDGDVLVIGWGSTRGAIEEAVLSCQEQGLSVGGLCLKIIYPLPLMLKDVLSKFKKVVTVELAYGDEYKRTPLSMFLRTKTLVDVNPIVADTTGRPISPMKIETRIKELISE